MSSRNDKAILEKERARVKWWGQYAEMSYEQRHAARAEMKLRRRREIQATLAERNLRLEKAQRLALIRKAADRLNG